jgi:hypothetical protein
VAVHYGLASNITAIDPYIESKNRGVFFQKHLPHVRKKLMACA